MAFWKSEFHQADQWEHISLIKSYIMSLWVILIEDKNWRYKPSGVFMNWDLWKCVLYKLFMYLKSSLFLKLLRNKIETWSNSTEDRTERDHLYLFTFFNPILLRNINERQHHQAVRWGRCSLAIKAEAQRSAESASRVSLLHTESRNPLQVLFDRVWILTGFLGNSYICESMRIPGYCESDKLLSEGNTVQW